MADVTTTRSMAHGLLEQLEADGELDGRLRYEILDGELVISGIPRVRHGRAVVALTTCFAAWVEKHGGLILVDSGIEVFPHRLRPDLAFVGPDRVTEVDDDGFRVAPDLVVEVTSPGTRSLDLHEKREIYEAIGVDEYWVVDQRRDVVVVHRLEDGDYEAGEVADGVLTARRAPGLEVPVAKLFPLQG